MEENKRPQDDVQLQTALEQGDVATAIRQIAWWLWEAKARFEQGELLISQGYDMMLAGMHVITEIEEVIERLEEACK